MFYIQYICIQTGEKRKLIQPTSLKDPKLEKLKEVSGYLHIL